MVTFSITPWQIVVILKASSPYSADNEMITGSYSEPVSTLHLPGKIESVMQERLTVAWWTIIVLWNLGGMHSEDLFISPSFHLLLWVSLTGISDATLPSGCLLEGMTRYGVSTHLVVVHQRWHSMLWFQGTQERGLPRSHLLWGKVLGIELQIWCLQSRPSSTLLKGQPTLGHPFWLSEIQSYWNYLVRYRTYHKTNVQ